MQQEQLSGTVEKITFFNEANGFCVFKVAKYYKNKANNLITVVSNYANIKVGEYIKCFGSWVNDKIYGCQFKAVNIELSPPNSISGIEKYLSSGVIKGIGPSFAKRLIKYLGKDVLEILENNPEQLLRVPGIGQRRYQTIIATWQTQKEVRKIVIFLQEHGLGSARANKIYKLYKEQAITKIKENPYRLALEVSGIGFKIADNLAISLGIPKESIIRAEAGIRFILQQYTNEGHSAMELANLINTTNQQLNIPIEVINNAIEREILAKRIIKEQDLILLKQFYNAEQFIAKKLAILAQDKPDWSNILNASNEIISLEQKNNIKFSNSQILAIKSAIEQKIIIITGGPGVGKTTVAKTILNIIVNKTNKILLAAPTGKAAKRLSETTNMPAVTLHRLLALDPKTNKFKYNEDNLLDAKLMLLDEVSMIDLLMFNNLLKALPEHCALILMGDIDQLPSVGAGKILTDLIESDCLRVVKLKEIFRQAACSEIIVNAHRINNSQLPILENNNKIKDFYFIKLNNMEEFNNKLINIIKRIELKFNFNFKSDMQILSPMNKGVAGVLALNNLLQQYFNNNYNNTKKIITKFGNNFVIGDKIIQIVNNYDKEVFNGDIGIIEDIDLEDSSLLVNFDNRIINYDFDELDEITLAYAITIHKSQGSEYPVVIIPVCLQHYTLLQKNLIYTGVTRGKKLVILLGELQALTIGIKNINSKPRLTTLKERIINKFDQNAL